MRPRVFPAEDIAILSNPLHRAGASMRPRVFPAEDTPSGPGARRRCSPGFNEAAGIPRGRRTPLSAPARQACPASMRPRVFPAEDARDTQDATIGVFSFNEAAGIPRGRHYGRGVK